MLYHVSLVTEGLPEESSGRLHDDGTDALGGGWKE
jgi:hypothetical protein